jgi:hypothetical protein
MALPDGIRAALAAGPGLAAEIEPRRRREFLERWRAVVQGEAQVSRQRRDEARRALAAFLEETLPPSHPVIDALDQDTSPTSAGTVAEPLNAADLDALLAALEAGLAADGGPEADRPAGGLGLGADHQVEAPADDLDAVIDALRRTARAALLAHPNRDAAQVRAAGGDPYAAGLLRLTGPDGEPRLPDFQFGPDGRPLPTVVTINELLGAADDPWGVAAWWFDHNGYLADAPAAVLGRLPDEDLIALARGAMADD